MLVVRVDPQNPCPCLHFCSGGAHVGQQRDDPWKRPLWGRQVLLGEHRFPAFSAAPRTPTGSRPQTKAGRGWGGTVNAEPARTRRPRRAPLPGGGRARSLGMPGRALTASRCAKGGLWLPGALRSSLNIAKFPCDGCGQLINSKGSELDISWLLSLCLIVSAGEGRGYAGDSEVDKKGAGGPTELPFIAFAIALRLARPAWFPQGQPPCRGCPAGLESLVPSGLLQRQVQGRRGCPESFEGSEDFCSPARGLQWVLNWEEKGYQLTMKEGVRSPL